MAAGGAMACMAMAWPGEGEGEVVVEIVADKESPLLGVSTSKTMIL